MKMIMIALFSLVASSALAAGPFGDCNPYTVSNGDSSFETVYPCGRNYTVTYHSCKEGQTEIFWVSNTDNDGTHAEVVTCHNGTFYPKARGAVKHRSCIEGKIEVFPVSNPSNDGTIYQRQQCRNGRFVNI